MKGKVLPSRDAEVGDIVYIKHVHHNEGLAASKLGRIVTITDTGGKTIRRGSKVTVRRGEPKAMVRWYEGKVEEIGLRQLVSLTKKLIIAKHDVERFSKLIEDFCQSTDTQ